MPFDNCPTCERRDDHADWCDLKNQRFPNHTPNADETTDTFEVEACADCFAEDLDGWERLDDTYAICKEWEGYELVVNSHDEKLAPVDPFFSKSPCDVCHSPLFGDRWDAEMVFVGRPSQQSESVIHSASQPITDRR